MENISIFFSTKFAFYIKSLLTEAKLNQKLYFLYIVSFNKTHKNAIDLHLPWMLSVLFKRNTSQQLKASFLDWLHLERSKNPYCHLENIQINLSWNLSEILSWKITISQTRWFCMTKKGFLRKTIFQQIFWRNTKY